jgi:hypothetical protein
MKHLQNNNQFMYIIGCRQLELISGRLGQIKLSILLDVWYLYFRSV